MGISSNFAAISKLILRDLNNAKTNPKSTLAKYTKDDIQKYLNNPSQYEKQLREAVTYLYGASAHFRRLIQYFVGLTDLAYIVSPTRTDPGTASDKTINARYRRVLNTLNTMSIKTQFPKILTVCLREDVFYGTLIIAADCITIQQLPSDCCYISTVEGNVPNVTFDFSYFDSRLALLDFYPAEFKLKYNVYQSDRAHMRYQELDCPNSFAIKCNNDFLDYALPPFAGILREIYDLEDYKSMKYAKTALENYALLVMTLPMNDDGEWAMDYDKAVAFWRNLDGVLPEEIGTILSPMAITKIGFEKSNTGDTDTVAEAEENLFSAAGVSSLLFSNDKASANALTLSIKVDQAMTYGIVRSIEDMVNRFIQAQSYGRYFKVTFLDVSPFNRKEMADQFLKAATYGMPTISMYAATVGLPQSELDSMSYLETEVLGLQKMFKPLQGSSTMSSSSTDSEGATDEGGAPTKDIDELSESGEQNREDA